MIDKEENMKCIDVLHSILWLTAIILLMYISPIVCIIFMIGTFLWEIL